MKKEQAAIPRHIVVDTSTGEVVGVAKRSRAPVVVAVVLALALVVCVSMYAYIHTRPAQEPEPQQTTQEQERIASDFLHEKAQERSQKIDEMYGPGAYGGTDWLNGE